MNIYSPFKKEKTGNDRINKRFLIIFAAAAATLLIVSTLAVLMRNNFDLKSSLGGDATTEATQAAVQKNSVPASDRYYLLYCSDSETSYLDFVWIVRLKLPKRTIAVFSPDTEEIAEYSGNKTTLSGIYATFGEEALKEAVEKLYSIKIAKYIASDSSGFKSMANYLGSMEYAVEEKIDYRGNFNLFLIKGNNTMRGDLLYKYLMWLSLDEHDNPAERCNVLIAVLENTLTPSSLEKSDALYSKLTNTVKTDFSIVDLRSKSDIISYVFTEGIAKKKIAENIDELTG